MQFEIIHDYHNYAHNFSTNSYQSGGLCAYGIRAHNQSLHLFQVKNAHNTEKQVDNPMIPRKIWFTEQWTHLLHRFHESPAEDIMTLVSTCFSTCLEHSAFTNHNDRPNQSPPSIHSSQWPTKPITTNQPNQSPPSKQNATWKVPSVYGHIQSITNKCLVPFSIPNDITGCHFISSPSDADSLCWQYPHMYQWKLVHSSTFFTECSSKEE